MPSWPWFLVLGACSFLVSLVLGSWSVTTGPLSLVSESIEAKRHGVLWAKALEMVFGQLVWAVQCCVCAEAQHYTAMTNLAITMNCPAQVKMSLCPLASSLLSQKLVKKGTKRKNKKKSSRYNFSTWGNIKPMGSKLIKAFLQHTLVVEGVFTLEPDATRTTCKVTTF